MANWISTKKLTNEQRLDVLGLLNRTDAALGREGIDESRRRSVVHGWSAQHWLAHENEQLVNYAIGSPASNTTLEMCGGGFFNRALAYEGMDDEKSAYFDYQKAVELSPDWVAPKTELARFHVERKE